MKEDEERSFIRRSQGIACQSDSTGSGCIPTQPDNPNHLFVPPSMSTEPTQRPPRT